MNYEQALYLLNTRLSRRVGNNTHLLVIDGSTLAVRLHDTNIVLIHKDGSYTLFSGGYHSVTTKRRINEFCPKAGLHQRKGEWFVAGDVPFYDGIKINQKTESPTDMLANGRHVYEEIWVEKSSHRLADIPGRCPVCKALCIERDSVGQPWESAKYRCGGEYKSKPQIQNHTDKWWGSCPKVELCAKMGLNLDVPEKVLYDALIDAGIEPPAVLNATLDSLN
jgi:hypothetical protein